MGRVLQPFEYFEPTSVAEATSLASVSDTGILAGGSDLILRLRLGQARFSRIVSLGKVPDLGGLGVNAEKGLEIGALVRLAHLDQKVSRTGHWGALHDSLDQLHPPQVHNMGTLVGNICAAVPHYDLPTALTALNAELRIVGSGGERRAALADFYVAPGKTALRPDELVSSIVVPRSGAGVGSAFAKIFKARRRAGDLQKVNAAARLAIDAKTKRINEATVVIGSCGFRPWRAAGAEAQLVGEADGKLFEAAAVAAAEALQPLTDVPWLEASRRGLVRSLVQDVLDLAARRALQPVSHAAPVLNIARGAE